MSFFSSNEFPTLQKPVSLAIVRSESNKDISESLLEDTIIGFKKCGISPSSIEEFRVPGAFEIPHVVARLSRSGDFDGIITLGVVIKGDTPHFEYICENVSRGLMEISITSPIPLIFGVLTVLTHEQAITRISKGREFAAALVKMIQLMQD